MIFGHVESGIIDDHPGADREHREQEAELQSASDPAKITDGEWVDPNQAPVENADESAEQTETAEKPRKEKKPKAEKKETKTESITSETDAPKKKSAKKE